MPTYSYRCTECDNAFDIQQAFTDATLTECPVCGGKLRKVFSPVGVTFNGSGFYRTDSRAKPGGGSGNGASGGSSESSGSSSGSSGSSSEGASSSKPAEKSGSASSTPKAAPAAAKSTP